MSIKEFETTIVEVNISHANNADHTMSVNGCASIADIIDECYKIFNLEEYQFEVSSWYLTNAIDRNQRLCYDKTPLKQRKLMREWIKETQQYENCPVYMRLLNKHRNKVPPRSNKFIEWLRSDNSTANDIPKGIPYPDYVETGKYNIVTGDDRLWNAIHWSEFDVAKKLIESGIFDLNMMSQPYAQTPLNELCCQHNWSRKQDYLALIKTLLNSDEIDLEKGDYWNRTPLANYLTPVWQNNGTLLIDKDIKIAKLLLTYGANINESVAKVIYCNTNKHKDWQPKLWVYDFLKEIRCTYKNALQNALLSHYLGNIVEIVLDYMLCNPNVKNKFDEEMKEVHNWLKDVVKLPQYFDTFIQNSIINMHQVLKFTVSEFVINNLSHRKTIKNAIKQLNESNKPSTSKESVDKKRKAVDEVTGLDEIPAKKRRIT